MFHVESRGGGGQEVEKPGKTTLWTSPRFTFSLLNAQAQGLLSPHERACALVRVSQIQRERGCATLWLISYRWKSQNCSHAEEQEAPAMKRATKKRKIFLFFIFTQEATSSVFTLVECGKFPQYRSAEKQYKGLEGGKKALERLRNAWLPMNKAE